MSTTAHQNHHTLDSFTLSFEHDRSWGEAKKLVRQKTIKTRSVSK